MIEWIKLTSEQRIATLNQASFLSGIEVKAIEKDWWVTLILQVLFSMPVSQYLVFKGGTSLSKGWKLIQRFSEDIDIALDPTAFGIEYQERPSHGYVKRLKRKGCLYTSNEIMVGLDRALIEIGLDRNEFSVTAKLIPITVPDSDPQTLIISYPSLFPPHSYLADEVKLEFGVRSLNSANTRVVISSILSEFFPNAAYPETPFQVLAVEPKKTFLEKMCLLHEKFIQQNGQLTSEDRLSRHLYDLAMMIGTSAEHEALGDLPFFSLLLNHREHYVRLSGIDYKTLTPQTLNFIPTEEMMDFFRADYLKMQDAMIYGQSVEFGILIEKLRALNKRVNNMI